MIGLFITLFVVYVFVAFVGGLAYRDLTTIRPRLTLTECWATTIFWPFILPILMLKALIGFGKGLGRVFAEVPNALTRLWQS